MASKVYIGNLPQRITEDGLKDVFAQIGDVQEVKIVKDPATGRSKGFGFVEMALEVDAYRAVHILNGTTHAGKRIEVKEA
jgi:RNA recognition motif-containing protein